ncbi:MAG: hypothetical protein A3K67_07625 [Euryarchaeota archaeon RBG_16_62_10]|nr:MAG: hypothetical protein A3K67_07625 [Euryarchaeota archaeon RBG_16_62_10]
MRASVKDAKALAFIEAVLLVALALLSAGSEPPVVDIPSVPSIDEGTVVRVSGHVVDIWAWDDGSENLVLADLASGATLRALCRPCPGAQPSDRASIGDLVSATGEVARSGLQTMLVVEAGGIVLVSQSEEALGLEELASNWALFERDEISLRGLLVPDGGASFVLSDLGMTRALRLSGGGTELARLVGQVVVVTGVLEMDAATMSLELRVESAAPGR